MIVLEFSRCKIFKKKTQNKTLIKLNLNFIIYFYGAQKLEYFKLAKKELVWIILQKGDLELTKVFLKLLLLFSFSQKNNLRKITRIF